MARFPYRDYDGIGLADLMKKREVSPVEVVEAAIEEIEKQNPLNAVINKWYTQAREAAKQTEQSGEFAGVPMLLKNIGQEVNGELCTLGSKAYKDNRAKEDSTYVERVRKSGVIFVGQTNVPELGLMAITEPAHHGPTRNPWNTSVTPGGSSGGSAAAVASGMVPIAGANDGGGSIRIPAAFTGLFGLKPTRGRTPVGRKDGRLWQGAVSQHVLTRSVRDSALMLDLIKGYESGAAFHTGPYDTNYYDCIQAPIRKPFRIAFSTISPIDTEVHPECKEAVLKTVKLLDSMGHMVEEKNAPVNGSVLAKSYMTLYLGEVAATVKEMEKTIGRIIKIGDIEHSTHFLRLLGKEITAEEFVLGIKEWDRAAFSMEEFHETYDFYVTPTTAFPPSKIGALDLSFGLKQLINIVGKLRLGGIVKRLGVADKIFEENLKLTPFTQLANLTGQPAISVPLHVTKDGLPVGVQFMASKGREDLLFQMAALLEQTDTWVKVNENRSFN
jgi:amidase